MGMQTVNMPGGEIIPSAQRGVIDCAEWVGGVEDLRLGFQNVWKYHYTPGVHENATVGELLINGDVWKALTPQQQEIIKSAANETFLIWWAKWQRQNADALKEMQEKHGVQILRTPPDILIEFLKTWDEIAKEESAKNPFFKKVHDSQRAYAVDGGAGQAVHVPAVLVRGQLLLPREEVQRRRRQHRPRRRSSADIARPLARSGPSRESAPLVGELRSGETQHGGTVASPASRLVRVDRQVHRHHRHAGSPGSSCRWCWR